MFTLLVSARAVSASDPTAAMTDVGVLIGAGLLQYFAARWVLVATERLEFVVRASVALVVTITVLIALLLADSDLQRVMLTEEQNPVGFSAIVVASGAASLAVVSWLLINAGWREHPQRLFILALALVAFLLSARLALATGTRSALIAFIAVGLAMLVLGFSTARVQVHLVLGIAAATILVFLMAYGGAVSFWFAELLGEEMGPRWERLLLLLAQIFDPELVPTYVRDLSIEARAAVRDLHWSAFYEQFWWGAGPRLVDSGFSAGYPHNLPLEILSYYGVFGFLLLSFLILLVAVRALRLARQNELGLTGFIAVAFCVANLVQLQFSMTLWMAKPLFFGLAILVTIYERAGRRRSPRMGVGNIRAVASRTGMISVDRSLVVARDKNR